MKNFLTCFIFVDDTFQSNQFVILTYRSNSETYKHVFLNEINEATSVECSDLTAVKKKGRELFGPGCECAASL